MKANNIPRTERLKNRINKLKGKLCDQWQPNVGGNPYPVCKDCHQTNVQVSMSGHGWGCKVKGLENELRHYQSLLDGKSDW